MIPLSRLDCSSVKKDILKNFSKFIGKHQCRSLFFRPQPATLLKRESETSVFLRFLRNFQEHLFYGTPQDDFFVILGDRVISHLLFKDVDASSLSLPSFKKMITKNQELVKIQFTCYSCHKIFKLIKNTQKWKKSL